MEYNPWQKLIVQKIEIVSLNRVGLIRDITIVISKNNVNIEKINNRHIKKGEESKIDIIVSIPDVGKLSDLIKQISEIKDVKGVKVVK